MTEKKDLQTEAQGQQQKLLDVVRKTIFPKADNAELALFIHKCAQVGVHPLDKMIIPVKFKNTDGTFTVAFICSIDFFRSRSDSAGDNDGMDEPDYGGESELSYTEDIWDNGRIIRTEDRIMTVPDFCRVKVYRRGIPRPFVGVARWKEYYPGQKKGAKWRQMPYLMLAKCAEALARRTAWPLQLNKLYTEEEMMLTITAMAGVPNIKANMQEPTEAGQPEQSAEEWTTPDDETRKANRWISEAQEKRLYALCGKSKVNPENVRNWIREVKKNNQLHICHISWAKANKTAKSEYDMICETIETNPKFLDKYAIPATMPTQEPKESAAGPSATSQASESAPPYTPTPKEEFEATVRDLLESSGKGDEALAKELLTFGYKAIVEVKEADYKKIKDHLAEVL